MRVATILALGLFAASFSAKAEISVNIGFNLGGYPDLVAVPDYPVYYAPQLDGNLFFYDGLYWVYAQDRWYTSSWYNGPWDSVPQEYVPLFILRVPVRYYRRPPAYFADWGADAPPRWGSRWGQGWEREHRGWDQWARASAPRPAPLPVYQRDYSGNRYPGVDQQRAIRDSNYRYTPHEADHSPRGTPQRARPAPEQRQSPNEHAQPIAPTVDARRPYAPASVTGSTTHARSDTPSPANRSAADPARLPRDHTEPTQQAEDRNARPRPSSRAEPQRPVEDARRKYPPPAATSRPDTPIAEPRNVQPERGPSQRELSPSGSREQSDKPSAKEQRREPDRDNKGGDARPHASQSRG